MKKSLKVLSAAGLSAAFVASTIVPAEAAVINRVVQDENGTLFQFSQSQLQESFVEYLGDENSPGAKLYKHFVELATSHPDAYVAFEDDKKGYISFASISEAFIASLEKEESFNVDKFTESDEGTPANITTVKKVSVDENGDIIVTDSGETDPVKPDPGKLAVKSANAITDSKIRVEFNKPVDGLTASNISINGLSVTGVELDETKTIATISTGIASVGNKYTINFSNVQIEGQAQEDFSVEYTVPDATSLYQTTLTIADERTVVTANGKDAVLVTFELTDANGVAIKDADKVEVAFTSTFGNFAEKRVTVQNGIAQALFVSESLEVERDSLITATVVEAANQNLINLKAERTLKLDPNPDAGDVEDKVGATLTDVAAAQADRVLLYFNKDVNVDLFNNSDKISTTITTNVNNDLTGGTSRTVVGYKEVDGNSKALYAILDKSTPLTDNARFLVKVDDATGTVTTTGTKNSVLTDARKPAMLDAKANGLTELKIVFSESIEDGSAKTLTNWVIDGLRLNDKAWGDTAPATITVGEFDPETQVDERNIVTVKLGKDKNGDQIFFKAGTHSVQGSNIGDWANLSDSGNNILNTQTLDFSIAEDKEAPTATVEVQSPEQFIVKFNKELTKTLTGTEIKLQKRVVDAEGKVTWVTPKSVKTGADVNYQVTNIKDAKGNATNNYKVELKEDWTEVYNTKGTKKNHYNDVYRLYIAENTVTAAANGIKNVELPLLLEGAMKTPDVNSPSIDGYTHKTGIVTMSEPVKFPVTLGGTEGDGIDTTAQDQGPIPTPTAVYIKKDGSVTVPAKPISTQFVDAYDTQFVVTPLSPLEAGEWQLVVRSISDDIGNTAASATFDFTITEDDKPVVDRDFKVIWSYADTDYSNGSGQDNAPKDGEQDAVYVKFNKPVKTTGSAANALSTTNYTLNGAALPEGTQIIGNIVGYDDKDAIIDSVTIVLPDGSITDTETTVITVSEYIQSAAGEKLTNGGQYKLSHNIYNSDSSLTLVAATTGDADQRAAANLRSLQTALADESFREIILPATFTLPANTEIEVNRLVDLDLGANTYDSLTVTATEGGLMKVDNGTLTDLTVDTPNADFIVESGLTVTGKTTIKDVLSSTFTNNGNLADVVIEDSNGTSFNNVGTVSGTLSVTATGAVTLEGTGSYNTIDVDGAAVITIPDGTNISAINVNVAGVILEDGTGSLVVTNDPSLSAEDKAKEINMTTGTLAVSPSSITVATEDTVTITVNDSNANLDAEAVDTVTVTYNTSGDSAKVVVTLTETGADTGVFTKDVTFVPAAAKSIIVKYRDEKDATGNVKEIEEEITVTP